MLPKKMRMVLTKEQAFYMYRCLDLFDKGYKLIKMSDEPFGTVFEFEKQDETETTQE